MQIQFGEVTLDEIQEGKGVGNSWRVDVAVGDKHPLADQREENGDEEENPESEGGKLLPESVYFGGVALQEGTIDDVPGDNVKHSEGE